MPRRPWSRNDASLGWLLLVAVAVHAAPAAAYIDPGSGSLIIQLILGGIAGLGVVLKLFWHRLVAPFRKAAPEAPAPTGSGPARPPADE